ncbi:MAG: hypothetical protein EA397_14770 [Deltaproteobacteria bacterium]|nr:MAG: hypothetical protein EA397_14770 [Deltaproteobacteria bacterium]
MSRRGQARTDRILSLIPPSTLVIDVGADHGYVAAAVGAIATERQPHRRGSVPVRWVIADGLSPFREVECAVIAGMGALSIQRILDQGPRPSIAILHAPDDPQRLRRTLAESGYRIDAECLAPEGNRYAEILRVVEGREHARGLWLEYGPLLLQSDDPFLRAHLEHHRSYHESIAKKLRQHAPERAEDSQRRVEFLRDRLESLNPPP